MLFLLLKLKPDFFDLPTRDKSILGKKKRKQKKRGKKLHFL